MKKMTYILLSIVVASFCLASCEDVFLEKRIGSDLNVDSIFSTREKSFSAIAQAYSMSLVAGITTSEWDRDRQNGLIAGTLSQLSGEVNHIKFNWEDAWKIQRSGMTANDGSGKPMSSDGFAYNYRAIRQCYLVIENIDKVADISLNEKNQIKAEMQTLIAYRYQEMLKRYGGVPIVTKTLTVEDNLEIPRATVKQVMEHIERLCDEAVPLLPNGYDSSNTGRITKGIAMAIKAEAYMYVARPLFNSAMPYMDMGTHNQLICYGVYDASLWDKAIQANLDVIEWALKNGYKIIDTDNPFNDYGTAVATPGNDEVLLAYKSQNTNMINYDPHAQTGGANGMSYLQLTYYHKTDGTDQTWTDETWVPYNIYVQKVNELEPRFKVSATVGGQDSWNNPGSEYWSSKTLSNASDWAGRGGTEGAGRRVKFWYMAGLRNWFEFPIYRLAEFYLNLAEAYNEVNNPGKSHGYLNVIRDRAGLPAVTETDQKRLRQIIQREWAVEFYEENHRYFDVKHWKLPDIGNGMVGGPKKAVVFQYVNGESGWQAADYIAYSVRVAYTGFWANNQYLEPFPIAEVNKGYLKQNPGY